MHVNQMECVHVAFMHLLSNLTCCLVATKVHAMQQTLVVGHLASVLQNAAEIER